MNRHSRVFGIIEACLIALAVTCLTFYAVAQVHRSLLSRFALREFGTLTGATAPDAVSPGCEFEEKDRVDATVWPEKRLQKYLISLALYKHSPIAVLRMKSRDIQAPVFEGTDTLTLNRGVGWIVGTSRPGEPGNVGLAGHRDSFFYKLKDVSRGDVIELCTAGRRKLVYTVARTEIVAPDAVQVLAATVQPSLTLVTCYPFSFVGNAPKRFIVRAALRDDAPPSAPLMLPVAKPQLVRFR